MSLPLVSCITPTYNRREFFPRSIECFLNQDYSNLEWVIVDNGTDSIQDLLSADLRIRYCRHTDRKLNHGELMNLCCEMAYGELLCVWDDDDIYPHNRVTRQIMPMIENPALELTGTSTLYYYQHGSEKAHRFTADKRFPWLGAIAFRKQVWETRHFDELHAGADSNFQRLSPPEARFDLADPTLVVATIHNTNASPKNPKGRGFTDEQWGTIEGLLCTK